MNLDGLRPWGGLVDGDSPAEGSLRSPGEASYFVGIDVVVAGIAYDGSAVYRKGAALAPQRIRELSAAMPSAHFIAVSATNLQSVYLPVQSYGWLKAYKPVAQIGYSIFVYDIGNDAIAHNNLGIVFLQYHMLDQALQEFQLAANLQPENATARFNLGVAHAFRSDFVAAGKSFRKALELDPTNRLARRGLEIVHAREAR